MNRTTLPFFLMLIMSASLLLSAQMTTPKVTVHGLFEEDQRDQQIDDNAPPAAEQRKLRSRYDQREEQVKHLMQGGGVHKTQDFFDAGVILTHSLVPENQLLAHLAFTAAAFDGIAEAKHLAATSLDRYLTLSKQTQFFGTAFQLPHQGWHHDVSPVMNDPIRAAFCVPAGKQLDKLFEQEKSGIAPPDDGHDEFWDVAPQGCH
jgi:hypothetical protein